MKRIQHLFILVTLTILLGSSEPGPMTWVALGDSITYLNEHLNETGNRVTKGYMTRVVEKLPYVRYTNRGYNGWTAGRVAQRIDTLPITKADIYSVFLGTNDWWAGRPIGRLDDYVRQTGHATLYGSFRIIIDKLRALNPQAHIILITPMQRADFVYLFNYRNNAYGSYQPKNNQTLEAFARAIDSIGRYERLDVVDLYHSRGLQLKKLVNYKRLKDPQTGMYRNYTYPAFKDIPFNPQTDDYPYPEGAVAKTYDGLHPSDKGYELISHQLIRIIKKYR